MKVIILAGGSGTRLFPLSRNRFPKQFLKIHGKHTLLQNTVNRFLKLVKEKDITIITNEEYRFLVKNQLSQIGIEIPNLIFEPVGRNTAPSIALGLKYLKDILKTPPDEPVLISPSDHFIQPEEKFIENLSLSQEYAKDGYIVTFGIKPDRPETGFGYIEADESGKIGQAYRIKKFHEKPDIETARRYIQTGNHYWNSGMFLFSIKTALSEFEKHAPEISKIVSTHSFDEVLKIFGEMPDISIDHAVMEKTDRGVVLPLDIKWSDIGSWDSVYEILQKDSSGNVKKGNVVSIDTKNSLIFGSKRVISTIGLEDLLIVETDDVLLVAKKGEGQKVKEIVNILKNNEKTKNITEYHTTVYRPWGKYTDLDRGERYRIKKITVQPGEALSLQMHHHRSEHWVVVKGTAKVILEDKNGELKEYFVHENESIYVPKSTKHRLLNPGKIPLEIIEVQVGEYIEEDDIIRFDDIYGRKK